MKPILPSLREKKRYVVFEVVSKNNFSIKDVKKEIEKTSLNLIGTLGFSKAGIMVLNDYENKRGIVKVNNKYVNELKMALALIKNIEEKKVIVNSVGVSGILNKARKRYLEV
jgi:ribonuclease P/MRP protein subunit POP5